MISLRFSVLIAFIFSVSIAGAQSLDRVWLEPASPTSTQSDWYPRAIEIVEGRIVDMDDKQLRMVIQSDDDEMMLASMRVIWIELGDVTVLQAEAIEHFDENRYSECLKSLPAVLQERPPVWRQQWLTMMAANAARKSSRGKISLELVSQLDRRELPLMVLSWLPIAWDNRQSSTDEIASATDRIDDPSSATRLVAASWLLSSKERSQATEILKTLAADSSRPTIASLAQCVLWRTATPPQVKQSYQQWQDRVEALPMVLQTGPMVTIAEKLRSTGLSDASQAMAWSLELTPIHPHPTTE